MGETQDPHHLASKIFVYMSQCKQKNPVLFFQKAVYRFATRWNAPMPILGQIGRFRPRSLGVIRGDARKRGKGTAGFETCRGVECGLEGVVQRSMKPP